MKKVKYYYDPETLSYKRTRNKKHTRVRNALIFLLAVALFGSILSLIIINSRLFLTPREVMLAREIKAYETNYEILGRKMELVEQVLVDAQECDNNMYRLYFNAPIIPDSVRKGSSNPNKYKDSEKLGSSKLVTNITKRLDKLRKRLVTQSKSLDETNKLFKEKEKFLVSILTTQPVSNRDLERMAPGYGWRSDPFTKARKFYYGMDLSSLQGIPAHVTGDGVVIHADDGLSGYGNHIRIDYGYGYVTLYGYLSAYNVRAGQHAKRGGLIGRVGSTGRPEAPHLYYEVIKNGEHVSPVYLYYGNLSADEYAEMPRVSIQESQSLDQWIMDINLPDKLYYSIDEVATAFGVNSLPIRFQEKEFEIISPKKDTKGNGKFSADDVKKLQLIYHLVREQGFTLEGTRQRLKDEKQKALSNSEIVVRLEEIKRKLVAPKEVVDN